MADGWHLCPSASWARDILPAVVCSIIVAPALTALGLPGVNGHPAGRMPGGVAAGSRFVVGFWRSAHSVTRGISYETGPQTTLYAAEAEVHRGCCTAERAQSARSP